MADLKEYKCPACGGAMEFDSATQKMKCPYCDTEMDISEFQTEEEAEAEGQEPEEIKPHDVGADEDNASWEAEEKSEWDENETDGMKVYTCESCGGEIIADDSTGATICPFCGNKVVMKEQFSGDMKPDYIIPFKLDEKAAKEAYLKHLGDKPFLPKVFKAKNHIDEIKGVYVPFWLFDVEADADIVYDAEKTRIWRVGKTEYTEHKTYEAVRKGTIDFEHIPADGSEKMDDTLMESVEPFDFKDAVPFKSAYLAGYVADRYDVAMNERIDRVKERVKKSAEESFMSTVHGYDVVTPNRSSVKFNEAKYLYTLYPVWILNTTWKDQKFVFAMNGQTGKIVGNLPTDKGLFWKYVGIRTPILAAIAYAALFIYSLI